MQTVPVQASPRMRLRFSDVRTRRAELDAVLQRPDVVRVAELNELEAVGFLHVLDPLIGLALRVYHQGPPSRVPGGAERENRVQALTSFCTAGSTGPQVYPSLVISSFLSLKQAPCQKNYRGRFTKLTQILSLLWRYYSL